MGANGNVEIRNDSDTTIDYKVYIGDDLVGDGELVPGDISPKFDAGWLSDYFGFHGQRPVRVAIGEGGPVTVGHYGDGNDVIYSFNGNNCKAVSYKPNPFGEACENIFGIGGEGGILQEAQDGLIHDLAAVNLNRGRPERQISSRADRPARQISSLAPAGVRRNSVSTIPRVKFGADGSVEQVDWAPPGLPIKGPGGDELLLRQGEKYDIKPEPWRQKLIDDGDAIDNHPPRAENRPVKKGGNGASPAIDNNDDDYPSQRAAVRDLKRRSGVPSDAKPVKVGASKARDKKNEDGHYREEVYRTHNPEAVGSDGVVIQYHKPHEFDGKTASGDPGKEHIHARPVDIKSYAPGNNGPVVAGTRDHAIVPDGSISLVDKHGKKVGKMMCAKGDSTTLYAIPGDHNHKRDATGNLYKHGVRLPDRQAWLFFSHQAQKALAATSSPYTSTQHNAHERHQRVTSYIGSSSAVVSSMITPGTSRVISSDSSSGLGRYVDRYASGGPRVMPEGFQPPSNTGPNNTHRYVFRK